MRSWPTFYVDAHSCSPNKLGEQIQFNAIQSYSRETHDVGAVGCLKEVNSAISVARSVMEHTEHTFLVGDDGMISCDHHMTVTYLVTQWSSLPIATKFALEMGFQKQDLQTNYSR